ncbi:MAG: hypothetical protein U1E76_18995 [Planctomycetota bacterium]
MGELARDWRGERDNPSRSSRTYRGWMATLASLNGIELEAAIAKYASGCCAARRPASRTRDLPCYRAAREGAEAA